MLIYFVLNDHFTSVPRTSLVQSLGSLNWLFIPVHAGMSVVFGTASEAVLCWIERRAQQRNSR